MGGRQAFNLVLDAEAGENTLGRCLDPERPALQCDGSAHSKRPVTKNAQEEGHCQRHSAPEGTETHVVRGARKRFRAECEISLRSSSVRKPMVPNSLPQDGGPPMRAPMAR